jgi:hypothetical protein
MVLCTLARVFSQESLRIAPPPSTNAAQAPDELDDTGATGQEHLTSTSPGEQLSSLLS